MTQDEIELLSTEEPQVLDRAFAEKCLAFVPPPKQSKADFAKFLDSLLNK